MRKIRKENSKNKFREIFHIAEYFKIHLKGINVFLAQ